MATTTATINVSSDILSYPITISKTMTMSKSANPSIGLEETTGLRTKKFTATTAFTWLIMLAQQQQLQLKL